MCMRVRVKRCMCVWVSVYANVYVWMSQCVISSMCICVTLYMCICIYVYMCMCASVYVCAHVRSWLINMLSDNAHEYHKSRTHTAEYVPQCTKQPMHNAHICTSKNVAKSTPEEASRKPQKPPKIHPEDLFGQLCKRVDNRNI